MSAPDPQTSSPALPGGILGGALLATVVLSPLPLGANRPLWWSLLAVAVGLLVLIYAASLLFKRRKLGLSLRALLGIALPYAAVLLWGALQALPLLPPAWAHPLWSMASDRLGAALPATVSINPQESLIGVMRLCLYAGVFWLFVQLGRERRFADRALKVLAGAGFAYALYGLILDIAGIERILWLRKWAYEGFVTSTFVNRNSFATYAALTLLCAGAVFFDRVRDVLSLRTRPGEKLRLLIDIVSRKGLLPLTMVAVIGMALLQSGSRAGAAVAALGAVVFVAAAAHANLMRWRQALAAIGLIAATGSLLFSVSGQELAARTGTLKADERDRGAIYALTAAAIDDQPFLGTGLGTFPDVFALYRSESFDPYVTVSQAHNSYLENALELGIPATVLLVGALAVLAATLVFGLQRRRRGRLFPALGIAACAVVATHALVDFSLEIPAVTVTFAAIAGIACAQSFRTRGRKHRALVQENLAAQPSGVR